MFQGLHFIQAHKIWKFVESKDILVFNLHGWTQICVTEFQILVLKIHKENIYKVIYSSDGVYMASSSKDHAFSLWRAIGTVVNEFLSWTISLTAPNYNSGASIKNIKVRGISSDEI